MKRKVLYSVYTCVSKWDVINEPVNNRDLMDILGDGVMLDWFDTARTADPAAKLYINDYDIITCGGVGNPHLERYLEMVTDLADQDAAFDGIGFQGHFRNNPTGPVALLEVLDAFGDTGKELWVTEYEFVSNDEQLSADYTRDLLTALFSHESVQGFSMWGFWDGARWNADKPIYESDWTLKPSGQAYIDLVHGDWWTDVTLATDGDGAFETRGYLGDYTVTVTVGDTTIDEPFSLDAGGGSVTVTVAP